MKRSTPFDCPAFTEPPCIVLYCGLWAAKEEVRSLSPMSSPGSADTSLVDESVTAAVIGQCDGPATPDEPHLTAKTTEDPDATTADRRPTAFVVDLAGNESTACQVRRRLPPDPLSRYVPPNVERSSAKRRADLIRKKLRHGQVDVVTRYRPGGTHWRPTL